MTDLYLAIVLGVQSVVLAAVSRIRWRCFPDPETGKCTIVSGCTEVSLIPSSDTVHCEEFVVGNDQRVLVISSKS